MIVGWKRSEFLRSTTSKNMKSCISEILTKRWMVKKINPLEPENLHIGSKEKKDFPKNNQRNRRKIKE